MAVDQNLFDVVEVLLENGAGIIEHYDIATI